MRVVRVITRLNRGGPLRQLEALVPGLARLGVVGPVLTGAVPEGEDDGTADLVARGVEVSSGTTSKFWAEHGVSYAAPNVAKALREHVGYARRSAKGGPQITPNGIKYVEQALSGKRTAA